MVFKLQEDGKYGVPDWYANYSKVPVLLLGELVIDLGEVFAEKLKIFLYYSSEEYDYATTQIR